MMTMLFTYNFTQSVSILSVKLLLNKIKNGKKVVFYFSDYQTYGKYDS